MKQPIAGTGSLVGNEGQRQWRDLADADGAQRHRFLHYLAFGLIVGGTIAAVEATFACLQGERSPLDLVGMIAIALVGVAVYLLDRRGQARRAEFLTGGLFVLIPAYYMLLESTRSTSMLFFAAGIVFASFLIGGQSGRVVATINVLVYAGIGLAYENGWLQVVSRPSFSNDLVTVAVICYGLTILSGLFTRDVRQTLRRSGERERALRIADEEKGRLLAELQARDEEQQLLLETIHELGSPIIPLAPGVVALPLIGAVDGQRAQQVTAALFQGVTEHRATVAIVDVTGVPVVDTALAEALLQAAQGARLLGAEPVLTGIRAETALTLVGLGLDLTGITTLATLQEGLEYAIASRATGQEKRPTVGAPMIKRREET